MTRSPDFDELVGFDLDAAERQRLKRVHELLLEAGPPAELSPQIESGPTLAMTLTRPRRQFPRRMLLLAAALAVLALAFLGGYATGNGHSNALHTLKLSGTAAAPTAFASLQIDRVDAAGNWPMRLSATGLPKLPERGYYAVFLIRNGKFAPCGTFVVTGKDAAVSVTLNAPYRLHSGDSWVVTRQMPGVHEPGPVVLKPTV